MATRIIRVKVTEEDIREWIEEEDAMSCPIAKAIERKTGKPAPMVTSGYVGWIDNPATPSVSAFVSEVDDAFLKFRDGVAFEPVKPRTITVRIPVYA